MVIRISNLSLNPVYANAIGKGMNPSVLLSTMSKSSSRLGSIALSRKPVQEKENTKLQPALLQLKIDLVSHPVHG